MLLAAFYALLAIEPRRENPFATPTHPTFSTLQDTRGTRLLLDFEKDLAGLNVSNATASLITHDRTPDHPHSLEVACQFSGQVGPKDDVLIALPRQMDLADIGTLLVDVQVRGRGPGSNSVQALFSIRTVENLWYQRDFTGFLPRGQWVTLSADFTGNSDDWLPVGHRVPWDAETRQSIDTFTIRFYNKNSAQVRLYLGSIRYRPASGPVESTQIASLYAESSQVPLYGKYEVSFRLTRPYQNPFDPDEVDVQGTFVSPSGRVLNVPAFFYQNYERRMENGQETLSAFGPKLWKIRFCPTEIGTHRYRIRVRDTSTALFPELSFETVPDESSGLCFESARPG